MAQPEVAVSPIKLTFGKDMGFALGIITILSVLFLPIPAFLIDIGLAFSIAFSVLILMVALWIQKPLDFSSFPTILLIATMTRLSLNIATTRVILSDGNSGTEAAGNVIGGFSRLVMGGDFVIGVIVFLILVVVNFIVITKGATRIAEVGARFTLDAIPGKQMAIDADLSAGLISEQDAQARRKELEQESSFFGSMDGASKFVRGDAIAGLIITGINIFGGVIIGYARHGMEIGQAADVFVRLSVGDGLVSQIPALIVSLAAGLLVSRGGQVGTTDHAVITQLSFYPRALFAASGLLFLLALMPGLPFIPFMLLGGILAFGSWIIPRQRMVVEQQELAEKQRQLAQKTETEQDSVKQVLKTAEVELLLGKQLSSELLNSHEELAFRVSKMRKKFATQFGFVVPEIKVSDDISIDEKSYHIRIHGTTIAANKLRVGELMVVVGNGRKPSVPGDELREPAFGMPAISVPEAFADDLRREGFQPIDNVSVVLTHLSEVIRNNLPQLLSYKDMKVLIDRLDPEYRKLADEICSNHMSYSGLQAVLKLLLAERMSIRNLHLVLEAVAELAPHMRKTEQIVEHVRIRMAQQLCGDLAQNGTLNILRLGSHWDSVFNQALKRDTKGEVIEFDIDPKLLEEFTEKATDIIRTHMDKGIPFVLVSSPDARPYVRMIVERIFATLPVLSHVEIAKGIEIKAIRFAVVITDPEGTILALFATFCRIGGCFMVLPGISTARVSLRIRLFLSIAISIAIIPLMWEPIYAATRVSNSAYIVLIAGETFIGVTLGLIARFITLGLQFSGAALSASIGFNAAPTAAILQNEAQGAITNLITVTAIVLLFISDFHHLVIQTIVNSYKFMPIGTGFEVRMALVTLTDTLSETFILMLRLASPFIVYGLIFNLAIGMVNKLAPQIPIYFISIPFILAGGLLLLYFGIANYLTLFLDGFIQIFQG